MATTVGKLYIVGIISTARTALSQSSHSRLVALFRRQGLDFQRCRLLSRLPRHYSTACTGDMITAKIVNAMTEIAPLHFAADWDNVGLLVEPDLSKVHKKIMLTNDLTFKVMGEARKKEVDFIISYHPPIFKPISRLVQDSWKENILIECMEKKIAVYSPHTSLDVIRGGVNDWLMTAFKDFDPHTLSAIEITQEFVAGNSHVLEVDLPVLELESARDTSLVMYLPSQSRLHTDKDLFTMHQIFVKSSRKEDGQLWRLRVEFQESELAAIVRGLQEKHPRAKYSVSLLSKVPRHRYGFGRMGKLRDSINLDMAVSLIKSHLGISHVSIARGVGKKDDDCIDTIAVCAGSGGSVLKGVKADLYVTGEMSHHEVLDAIHGGANVMLCHHSNTERGYLKHLKDRLSTLLGDGVEIFISEADKEPLQVV